MPRYAVNADVNVRFEVEADDDTAAGLQVELGQAPLPTAYQPNGILTSVELIEDPPA